MVNNQHKKELVNLYGQLSNEFYNYQFYNEQLYRILDIERKIKRILSIYAGNIWINQKQYKIKNAYAFFILLLHLMQVRSYHLSCFVFLLDLKQPLDRIYCPRL